MKKILRRLMAGALVVAAVAGAWALSSCSHDDEPPTQDQLLENLEGSVWKMETPASDDGPAVVEFICFTKRNVPQVPTPDKYLLAARAFITASTTDGLIYYDVPVNLGSNDESTAWIERNRVYVLG